MSLEPKSKNGLNQIEFIFNYTKQKIILSLEYILLESNKYSKELKTIIKEEYRI